MIKNAADETNGIERETGGEKTIFQRVWASHRVRRYQPRIAIWRAFPTENVPRSAPVLDFCAGDGRRGKPPHELRGGKMKPGSPPARGKSDDAQLTLVLKFRLSIHS